LLELADVLFHVGGGSRNITTIDERHSAADLLRVEHLVSVLFQNLNGGDSLLRIVVIDKAGRKKRHLLFAFQPLLAAVEPIRKGLGMKFGEGSIAMDSDGFFHHKTRGWVAIRPVRECR